MQKAFGGRTKTVHGPSVWTTLA